MKPNFAASTSAIIRERGGRREREKRERKGVVERRSEKEGGGERKREKERERERERLIVYSLYTLYVVRVCMQ